MKTREEIEKLEKIEYTDATGDGVVNKVIYPDNMQLFNKINELVDRFNELSSPEKKEVCKEAFESGYGGKLSKKAKKEFENIYSKLEKKEEVKVLDDFAHTRGDEKMVGKRLVDIANGHFEKEEVIKIQNPSTTKFRVEKEELTQEFTKKELERIKSWVYKLDEDYGPCDSDYELKSKIERLLK